MVGGGFAGVVGDGTFLGHGAVDAGGEDQGAWEVLLLPNFPGDIGDEETSLYIDVEGDGPFVIGDGAVVVGREEDTGGDDDIVDAAIGYFKRPARLPAELRLLRIDV